MQTKIFKEPILINKKLGINKIIFNPPATIIFWTDDTKTVAVADSEDPYSYAGGFCTAITKKLLSDKDNTKNFFNIMNSCLPDLRINARFFDTNPLNIQLVGEGLKIVSTLDQPSQNVEDKPKKRKKLFK